MRQLLGRSHCATGDNLFTMEIEAKTRKEAIHRESRFWCARGTELATGAQTLHSEGLGGVQKSWKTREPRLDSQQGERLFHNEHIQSQVILSSERHRLGGIDPFHPFPWLLTPSYLSSEQPPRQGLSPTACF